MFLQGLNGLCLFRDVKLSKSYSYRKMLISCEEPLGPALELEKTLNTHHLQLLISNFIAQLQYTEPQGQESDEMEPIDYAAEQHCVLCRNKIQFYYSSTCREQYDRDDLENFENWETAVMVLGCKQQFYSKASFPRLVGYNFFFFSFFTYFCLLL